MTQKLNPLEEMVEILAADYPDLVAELQKEIAPVRPWYTVDLSPDQQLWRWLDVRPVVLPWVMEAAAWMGAKTSKEALQMTARIFTDPAASDIIPPDVVSDIPEELLEIVQAVGPRDAGRHIAKMERMVMDRAAAAGILSNTDQPDVPDIPPPLPVELPGRSAGWPEYGGAAELAQAANQAVGIGA